MPSRIQEFRERAVGIDEVDGFSLDVATKAVNFKAGNTMVQDMDHDPLCGMPGYDRIFEPLGPHKQGPKVH